MPCYVMIVLFDALSNTDLIAFIPTRRHACTVFKTL